MGGSDNSRSSEQIGSAPQPSTQKHSKLLQRHRRRHHQCHARLLPTPSSPQANKRQRVSEMPSAKPLQSAEASVHCHRAMEECKEEPHAVPMGPGQSGDAVLCTDLAMAANNVGECIERREAEETSTALPPPVAQLYRHALESIFAFLPLNDLSAVCSTARSWLTAVGSMRCLAVTIPGVVQSMQLHPVAKRLLDAPASAATGVARHIVSIGSFHPVDVKQLPGVVARLPNLEVLTVRLSQGRQPNVETAMTTAFVLPPKLTHLHLSESALGIWTNEALAAAAKLPDLTSLYLGMTADVINSIQLVDFSSLLPAPALTNFIVSFPSNTEGVVTEEQLNQLLALPLLRSIPCEQCSNPDLFRRLLQRAREKPQWTSVGRDVPLNDSEVCNQLRGLPWLTHFHAYVSSIGPQPQDFSFLRPLVNLTDLAITGWNGVPKAVASEIQKISTLTRLELGCSLMDSQDMERLTPLIPRLKRLFLRGCVNLRSLQFICPSVQLAELMLVDCGVLHQLLPILPTLPSLRHLNLSTSVELSETEIVAWREAGQPFCPPSPVLPALRSFFLSAGSTDIFQVTLPLLATFPSKK